MKKPFVEMHFFKSNLFFRAINEAHIGPLSFLKANTLPDIWRHNLEAEVSVKIPQ
jgi:hypothetical protein